MLVVYLWGCLSSLIINAAILHQHHKLMQNNYRWIGIVMCVTYTLLSWAFVAVVFGMSIYYYYKDFIKYRNANK